MGDLAAHERTPRCNVIESARLCWISLGTYSESASIGLEMVENPTSEIFGIIFVSAIVSILEHRVI